MQTATIAQPKDLILHEVQTGKGNIAIQATAGAGKTYTLLQILKIIPRLKRSIFVSFSKAIVNELREKIPLHIQALTLHSLGCRLIMAQYKAVKIDDNKYFKFALEHFEKKTKETYKNCFLIQQLCAYARLTLTSFDEESLTELCDHYTIECNQECILVASIILQQNANLKKIYTIDFADMIYYPAVYRQLVTEQFDYVFLDEAQDLNKCQAQLVENIMRKPGGRIIFVGDYRQAIYSFTGSSVDSFEQLEVRFNSKRLSLKESYRCSKAVVRLAQTIYPDDISYREEAPEGSVTRGELELVQPGDMVICRNTKPLIAVFFDFIGRGVKSYIVGKDLEKGLIALAESVGASTTKQVEANIDAKLDLLLSDLKDKGVKTPSNDPKYVALLEKCEIILLILGKCNTANELLGKISSIFHEDNKAVRLLTAHRSKGLESERVFFIETFNKEKLIPSKYAILEWQKVQEQNLLFVTYTRAKNEFIFLDL
jgi:superfamily I DNA/RNA helicase